MKKLLIFLAVFLCAGITAIAQESTTFEWDLSTSEPLGAGGGYRLYASKQAQAYDDTKVVGTVASGISTITIDTSTYRGRYYFVADAFIVDDDSSIVPSDYSNEVSAVYRPNPPGNLRRVANVALSPFKKAGSVFASIFTGRKNLRIRE